MSVQRIVNAMASGTPTFVEYEGSVFQEFVEKYNYTCYFRDRRHLVELLSQLSRDQPGAMNLLNSCKQATRIVMDFHPRRTVQKYIDMFESIVALQTSLNTTDSP